MERRRKKVHSFSGEGKKASTCRRFLIKLEQRRENNTVAYERREKRLGWAEHFENENIR